MMTVRTPAVGPGYAIATTAAVTSTTVLRTFRIRSPADRSELNSRVRATAASTKQKIANSATAAPMLTPGQMTKTKPRTKARTPRSAASLRVRDEVKVDMRRSLSSRCGKSNTREVWRGCLMLLGNRRPRPQSSATPPSKEDHMSSLSDSFRKLADQIDVAEANVKTASSQGKADLQAKVDEARKSADEQSAQLRSRAEEASNRASSGWQEVQDDWKSHVQRIRQRVDEKKAEFDRDEAEYEAENAESDALDAIDFAAAAVEEAEYAVLDATLARADADTLATTA